MTATDLRNFADALEEQNRDLPPLKTARDYSFSVRGPVSDGDFLCAECGQAALLWDVNCRGEEQRAVCAPCVPRVARRGGITDATIAEFETMLREPPFGGF